MRTKEIFLTSLISCIFSIGIISLFAFKSNEGYPTQSDVVPIGTIIIWPGNTNQITPPSDKWKLCAGQKLTISDYWELYQIIRYDWRIPAKATEFYLPDLRGVFLRGNNEGKKPGTGSNLQIARFSDTYERYRFNTYSAVKINQNFVGSYQFDDLRRHYHPAHTHNMKSHSHIFQDVVINESPGWGGNNKSISTSLGSAKTDRNNGKGYYITERTGSTKSEMYASGVEFYGISENTVKNAAVNYYIKVK